MQWWQFRKRWLARYRCPHIHVEGIYGDEIEYVGGFRLWCLDCERVLDGPVHISQDRKQINYMREAVQRYAAED